MGAAGIAAGPGHPAPIEQHAPRRRKAAGPVLVARVAATPADWPRILSRTFLASAGGYAVLSGVLLTPGIRSLVPDLATREGALMHLGMTLGAAGLCLVAALAYRLPARQGRPLWSVLLAWLHVVMLHGAYLAAAAGFYLYHDGQDAAWWRWLIWGGVASMAGVAAMIGNVAISLRPPAEPDEPAAGG